MNLRDTAWLAKKLSLSISTIEKLRAEHSDDIPKAITINRSIRYSESYVEWWIQKKLDPDIADYSHWNSELLTEISNKTETNTDDSTKNKTAAAIKIQLKKPKDQETD